MVPLSRVPGIFPKRFVTPCPRFGLLTLAFSEERFALKGKNFLHDEEKQFYGVGTSADIFIPLKIKRFGNHKKADKWHVLTTVFHPKR